MKYKDCIFLQVDTDDTLPLDKIFILHFVFQTQQILPRYNDQIK